MVYIVTFLLSALAFQLSVSYKGNKIFVKRFLFIMAVMIPVMLAALRNDNVGIDTRVYARPLIDAAQRMNFTNFFLYCDSFGIEPGYCVITYFCAHYFGGMPLLLGICSLVTVMFVYLRIRDFKDEAPVFVMSFFYLCVLYNRSLNLIRQTMAMAIVFFALRYIDRKKIYFFVLIAVATLFHRSAILGILFFTFYVVSSGKVSKFKSILFLGASLISVLYYNVVLQGLVKIVFGENAKYMKYFVNVNTGFLNMYDVLFKIIVVALFILFIYKRGFFDKTVVDVTITPSNEVVISEAKSSYLFFFMIAAFNLILYFLRRFNGDNYRFSLYFQMVIPVIIPQFRKLFVNKSRLFFDAMLTVCMIFYWIITIMFLDSYGTIPYLFA